MVSRYALRTRGWSKHQNVTWNIFADNVLPYGILDEKRDLSWRWRPRLQQLLLTDAAKHATPPGPGPLITAADNISSAMHTITQTLPHAFLAHAVGLEVMPTPINPSTSWVLRPGTSFPVHLFFFFPEFILASISFPKPVACISDAMLTPAVLIMQRARNQPGQAVNWKSETAPAMLSPEQVVQYGGASCTGTAVILVAAARAVGIPARIAGCSQSIVVGDDHHWIEFYDPSDPGERTCPQPNIVQPSFGNTASHCRCAVPLIC